MSTHRERLDQSDASARKQPQAQAMRLATAVASELANFVTDVVIAPGSRNAPLTLALLARPDLRVHTRLDERSAAFLALGMARVQKRAVAVVMTSGSAVANCLPAVIEAAHSHTPLAIVSADRPQRLIGTGASQTISQRGLFSTVTETTHIDSDDDLAALRARLESERVVHINVAFDAPLLDEYLPAPALHGEDTGDASEHHRATSSSQQGLSHHEPSRQAWCDYGEVEVDLSRNTVVIAGDEAWRIDELDDVPTIAEPSAPAPYTPVHPLAAALLRKENAEANDFAVRTKPEQIIVVGHPTLHRHVLALITDPDIDVVTLSRTEDFLDLRAGSHRRGTRLKATGEPTSEWIQTTQAASQLASEAVRTALTNEDYGFTGVHVAAAVCDSLAVGDSVFVGASNPVRDVSLVGLPFDGVDTYAARGAAGIDGSVSQAVGVALATQSLHARELRAPRTVALLGDITFLHDVGGLALAQTDPDTGIDQPEPENLTIVVANDDGGGIFETLETGRSGLRDHFERAFGTPHGIDVGQICAGYGISHQRVNTPTQLLDALDEQEAAPVGILVIEAMVTRQTRRDFHAEIDAVVGG